MSEKARKLLLLFVPLVAVISLAIVINQHKNNDTVTKFAKTLNIDNSDENINWHRYPTFDINLAETLKIVKPGTYHLTGMLEAGGVEVAVAKGESVKLVLDNVMIKNPSGPAILCREADDLVIELRGENILEDGMDYADIDDEDIKGAIYSRADLIFEGSGILNLTANFGDGIIGKDDLKLKSGVYNITSKDDGIRGRDSVYLKNGQFSINSGADAIKTTNDLTRGKGFVLVEDGSYYLKSGAKGIKSVVNTIIYGGYFNIDSYDDAIHSDNYIGITDGHIVINSGDDAIHANRELIIDDGRIDIKKGYEGIEAQVVTINGGDISISAIDDGINAGAGADLSSLNRPGANKFTKNDENAILSINGGKIYINASGDGVDSNGYLYFNGGTTIIDGPTNDKNGTLDAGLGITMRGGEVIALGSSGMAETLGKNSTKNSVSIYFDAPQLANTKIEVKDERGSVIASHVSAKTFSYLVIGTDKFISTETYTLYINDEPYRDFTISDTVTTIRGNDVF